VGLKPRLGEGGALTREEIEENFDDLHPPLGAGPAAVEASRCLYCYDAPCVRACPTAIDIPGFIHRIRTGNLEGSATTILSANIMGGTCGRVCPTEILCEQACVLNAKGEEPIKIGALQRHAVEALIAKDAPHPFARAAPSGKTLAVIGAGPAGLSFAHRAAMLGHTVTAFEAKPKPGGLNEYGLAAYKMAHNFAQAEVEFLLGIGGITIEYGRTIGPGLSLEDLRAQFDAVFIGVGLGNTNRLGVPGEDLSGIHDAVAFIEVIRQSSDKSNIAVGRNVVVIGGGNTAIDAAVQAKRLGARNVTILYRRGEDDMGATVFERVLAQTNGVIIKDWSVAVNFEGHGWVEAVVVERTSTQVGETGKQYRLPADMVLKAIGQRLAAFDGLRFDGNKIAVNASYQTNIDKVFAGGDCIAGGADLTVQAVEDGKRAAIAVDAFLRSA